MNQEDKYKIKNESRSFVLSYGGEQQVVTINYTSEIIKREKEFELRTMVDTGRGYAIVKQYIYQSEDQDQEYRDTYELICSHVEKLKKGI
jgi:hypothetical protein